MYPLGYRSYESVTLEFETPDTLVPWPNVKRTSAALTRKIIGVSLDRLPYLLFI